MKINCFYTHTCTRTLFGQIKVINSVQFPINVLLTAFSLFQQRGSSIFQPLKPLCGLWAAQRGESRREGKPRGKDGNAGRTVVGLWICIHHSDSNKTENPAHQLSKSVASDRQDKLTFRTEKGLILSSHEACHSPLYQNFSLGKILCWAISLQLSAFPFLWKCSSIFLFLLRINPPNVINVLKLNTHALLLHFFSSQTQAQPCNANCQSPPDMTQITDNCNYTDSSVTQWNRVQCRCSF